MNLSRDSILALQRHFLGALSAPARTWLEPLPWPPLAFLGDAIRSTAEGCLLDFGSVSSPGRESRRVRVCHRGPEPIDVRLGELPGWLAARWLDCAGETVTLAGGAQGATLEVTIAHDAECEFRAPLQLVAGDRVEELSVRMTARRSHPIARFDFNGSATPQPFDFGNDDRSYELSVTNATSVPLVVTFADLPAWLTFEVDGRLRGGPMAGPFFERAAPFAIELRPRTVGPPAGVLRVRTNDPRPELQDIELQLAACVIATKPSVHVDPPHRVRLRADQTLTVDAQLENWSHSAARTSREAAPRALAVKHCPVVPAAREGQPGTVVLPIRITPAHLAPGAHMLMLSLRIEGGEPARVDVPVHVEVMARRTAALRPQTIAALFALLLLTLLFVIARGLS